ncbi:MAG: class I SAM-dependent methyltransferase [Propionibacteriaceae bacterium]|nr:class I SAM-dependent methyltransferase [Propionibacteriaceae bacterium]
MSVDPVASLILDEAGSLTGRVFVLDDVDGALTREAIRQGADVRAWCDDVREQARLPRAHVAESGSSPDWVPDTVLWRLPRSVSGVEDTAEVLAGWLAPASRVVAGARVKHMTPAQNTALSRSFAQVSASLGRQKSRVLHATCARPMPPRWPTRRYVPEVDLTVLSRGDVFNTNRLDDGTHLLLRTLGRVLPTPPARPPSVPTAGVAIDFGCGSGIIATWLAVRGFAVTGIDVSQQALASTRLTAAANRVAVGTRRSDGFGRTPAASADLIVSNPPFHQGAAKDSTPTFEMIRRAGEVLRPGGELWLVFNSHLPYLPALRAGVGVTTIEARDRTYIVTRSLKQPDCPEG